MGEIKFVIGLVMTTLFAIAIISFMVGFGSDNRAKINLANDSEFNTLRSDLEGQMAKYQNDTNSSAKSFSESTSQASDQTMEGGGQFKIGVLASLTAVFSVISLAFSRIFGSDTGFAIITGTLTALLVYLGIRYVYKTWWGKDPE